VTTLATISPVVSTQEPNIAIMFIHHIPYANTGAALLFTNLFILENSTQNFLVLAAERKILHERPEE
jgi:hypothetical protein